MHRRTDGRTDGRRTKSDHNSSSWAELRWAKNTGSKDFFPQIKVNFSDEETHTQIMHITDTQIMHITDTQIMHITDTQIMHITDTQIMHT